MIVLRNYYGHEIHQPTSGGKAGKGCARTSTLQVRQDSQVLKSFRYTCDRPETRRKALSKAKQFVLLRAFPHMIGP